MTKPQLINAIREAERFLDRAGELLRQSDLRRVENGTPNRIADEALSYWASGPLNASVKRASLDLTKALAVMRRYR